MGLLEIRPHVSYNGFWDFEGFQETGYLHVDTNWEWRSSYELHTGINFTREGVKEAFEIYPDVYVSPETYDNVEGAIVFITNRGARVVFELRTANSGLYIVLNENQDIHRSGLGWTRKDRSLIVKYNYLFDLLK